MITCNGIVYNKASLSNREGIGRLIIDEATFFLCFFENCLSANDIQVRRQCNCFEKTYLYNKRDV